MTEARMKELLINYKQDIMELEALETKFSPKSPVYSDEEKGFSKPKETQYIDTIDRKEELLKRTEFIRDSIYKLKSIDDSLFITLFYKYLGYYDSKKDEVVYLSLEQIGELRGCSLRTMQRKNSEALKKLFRIMAHCDIE